MSANMWIAVLLWALVVGFSIWIWWYEGEGDE